MNEHGDAARSPRARQLCAGNCDERVRAGGGVGSIGFAIFWLASRVRGIIHRPDRRAGSIPEGLKDPAK